jgi:hypothetical protein
LSVSKVFCAVFGKGPEVYRRVSLNNRAVVMAKFWIWMQKKLHKPMNEQMDFTLEGAVEFLMARSFASLGLIP